MGIGYSTARSEGRIEPLVDPLNQTIKLDDGSRISGFVKDGVLLKHSYDDATTLYEGVRRGARISRNGPMLGQRIMQSDGTEPFIWSSYDEILGHADDVGLAFRELGLPIGEGGFVGIFSKNRKEWIITEFASYAYSNVIVPLYETLGPDACAYIIHQTEMKIVVCDTNANALSLLQQRACCPSLSILVVMEPTSADLKSFTGKAGVKLLTFAELEELGKNAKNRPEHVKPAPETLATICYTSGTTGMPKGVMLTHANVIADATAALCLKRTEIVETDIMISFLPMAHMFERMLQSVCFVTGAKIGFYRGDIKLLPDDIRELRPTVVPVVPRVLNRLYDKVMMEVNKSRAKKALFDTALAFKKQEMRNFIVRNNSYVDQVVFKKIRESMGGRVKLMITGSAPIDRNVLTFIRAAMGCVVIEGYGQTECVAPCTVSIEGDSRPGHVGIPCPSVAVKLVDVPELGYFAKEDAGEVCVRGHTVFKGYYKNEEQTKEVLDEEGWLHTGDIGRWTPQGCLQIVDRKKHIFKLAQGEFVAPEKIESVYAGCKFVAQSYVYGESCKEFLVAVIVPDEEVLIPALAKSIGVKGTMAELCAREDVKKVVLEDILATGKAAGLKSFEQVKTIHLHPEPFTVENGLFTPTLKTKRLQLRTFFAKELAAMYMKLEWRHH